MSDQSHIRILTLGTTRVGKSCIIRRFLENRFMEKHKTTVEELYCGDFNLGTSIISVDIVDTCGYLEFPIMMQLHIATAHAFLFVYSVTDPKSFNVVRNCFQQVQENRPDYQEIPIVIAGNKVDLANTERKVFLEDVCEWAYCTCPRLRVKVLECSAKENFNIKDIFKSLLELSRQTASDDETTLRRRSSAHASRGGKRSSSVTPGVTSGASDATAISVQIDPAPAQSQATTPSSSTAAVQQGASTSSGWLGTSHLRAAKPRSRSLIRRCSKKTKRQVRDTGGNPDQDDCRVQ